MRHLLRLDHAAGLIGSGTAGRPIDGEWRKPLRTAQIIDHRQCRCRLIAGARRQTLVGRHGNAGGKNGAGGNKHEAAPGERLK